jgi:hypothetical protein
MKTQTLQAKNQLELIEMLKPGAKQSEIRTRRLIDYGALSNKMEVMEEFTKHWRK